MSASGPSGPLVVEIGKDIPKFVVCCSRDWCFKGYNYFEIIFLA